jgi:ATP-dependent Lon protease
MIVPLFVGRDRSVRAVEAAFAGEEGNRRVILVAQKSADVDVPTLENFYTVGVIANVLQMLRLPDGTFKVLIEGVVRVRIDALVQIDPFLLAEVREPAGATCHPAGAKGAMRELLQHFEEYARTGKRVSAEGLSSLRAVEDPGRLTDIMIGHLDAGVEEKQAILEMFSVMDRMDALQDMIDRAMEVVQVDRRIRGRVKRQMEKSHRDYYLNEQMKAIRQELGEKDEEGRDELADIADRIEACGMSEEARKKAESELRKLRHMPAMSAESTVVRNYVDWLVSVPWNVATTLEHDLQRAEEILEEDHYGLEKVKERILEYLAVQQRVTCIRGPILCLVGPPGVGKTSLAKSIARAAGRKYVRVSLGGVRDEAEIRGHRRTYIGSMPGKIIQSMKKAGSTNPLFLLDEIDKVGTDVRGDPASALLEVLDPEQNNTFSDHYMEVEYDLSNVMFITTANGLNIPRPLLDRMEVIRLAGYTEAEKVGIARRYLIPRQMETHGLAAGEFAVSDNGLLDTIRYYTREAGVRNLDRQIATLARKATRELISNKGQGKVAVTQGNLEKYLGVRQFSFGLAEEEHLVGVSTGLAWTSVGGELLSIESTLVEGKGKVTITGKLGDVMQESAQAAMTYARTRARDWIADPAEFFQKHDLHIHVPEGATPKDGPSAGIALCTAIVSALTGVAVRRDVAMTGEITLRGRVLIIGGLKEKLLAAHRAGIRHVLIPEENTKDLKEIPALIRRTLEIHPVRHMDEVLALALVDVPKRYEAPESGTGVDAAAGLPAES